MAPTTSLQPKSSTKRLATGLLDSATTLWTICAKHTVRVTKKLRPDPTNSARAKQLMSMISNKMSRLGNKKRRKGEDEKCEHGLWQRSILMGDKCDPLNFSGVIYYDNNGKLLEELPVRSFKGNPLPGYLTNSTTKREKTF